MKYGLSPSTIQRIQGVLHRYPQVERAILIDDPDVIEHIQREGVTFYDKNKAIPELAAT